MNVEQNEKVVTFALAHQSNRKIDLCAKHSTSEAAGVALGRVEHGSHRGACEKCESLAVANEARLREAIAAGRKIIAGAIDAEMSASAPDARRVIRAERLSLQSTIDASLKDGDWKAVHAQSVETRRVIAMWYGR